MAIAQVGTVQKSSDRSDPFQWNVTIPDGTTCIVFAASYYDGTGDDLASVDIGGSQVFTVAFNASGSTSFDMASMAVISRADLTTGAAQININWDSARDYVGQLYLLFLSGVDTSDPLRDSDSQQSLSPSLTFTTVSGDWVVCTACVDATIDWSNYTSELSEDVSPPGLYGSIMYLLADGVSETIGVTAINTGWGGIVLKMAGADVGGIAPHMYHYMHH